MVRTFIQSADNWLREHWLGGLLAVGMLALIPQVWSRGVENVFDLTIILPAWVVVVYAAILLLARALDKRHVPKEITAEEIASPPEDVTLAAQPYLAYVSDRFGDWQWSWSYEWRNFQGRHVIVGLKPLCPVDHSRLVESTGYYAPVKHCACAVCKTAGRPCEFDIPVQIRNIEIEIIAHIRKMVY